MTDDDSAAWRKCCDCCTDVSNSNVCVFNGRRDDHAGPCEDCEPEAYAAWLAEPRPEVSDAPF